ncbi:MAG: hypothetical protein ACR2RL_17690 [Gammaproteobacteria bacterium]
MIETTTSLASRWDVSNNAAVTHADAVVWYNTVPWRDYGDAERRARCLPRMRDIAAVEGLVRRRVVRLFERTG